MSCSLSSLGNPYILYTHASTHVHTQSNFPEYTSDFSLSATSALGGVPSPICVYVCEGESGRGIVPGGDREKWVPAFPISECTFCGWICIYINKRLDLNTHTTLLLYFKGIRTLAFDTIQPTVKFIHHKLNCVALFLPIM